MKKIFVLFALLTTFAFGAEKFKMSGAVGWYPLFMEDNSGKIYGLALEVTEELQKRMGIEVEMLTGFPWKRVLNMAKTGDLDMVAGTYYNVQRSIDLDTAFVMTPFMKNSVRLFVRKDNQFKFESLNDLRNKKGVKPLGGKYGEEFENFVKNNNIRMDEIKGKEVAFKMIQAKRADYFLSDIFDGSSYLKSEGLAGEIVPLDKEIQSFDVLYMISNKSPLIKRINEINMHLKNMAEDGTLDRLESKYR